MQRREFITLLGAAAAAWPLAARAQQLGRVWRIGCLFGGARPIALEPSQYGGFSQGIRELGYVEGRDILIEWRFAEGRSEIYPALAAELLRTNVDMIVTGNADAALAVQQLSKTIPIIVAIATDPVGNGIVASLAHPGGNITGLATSADDTAPKQLQILLNTVPNLSAVGLLWNPDSVNTAPILKNVQSSALTARLRVVPVEARSPQDIETAFAALKGQVGALIVASDAFIVTQRYRIAELAIKNRLPTMVPYREYVEAGGLMSYGESFRDFNRRAAFYVDQIIKGAKPPDLPVQQPTRFFLVINRKTANTLGLEIPPMLLALADEVIE